MKIQAQQTQLQADSAAADQPQVGAGPSGSRTATFSPGGALVRVGQQSGSLVNGSPEVSQLEESSVPTSDRYTPTPLVPGVKGSTTLKFRSAA